MSRGRPHRGRGTHGRAARVAIVMALFGGAGAATLLGVGAASAQAAYLTQQWGLSQVGAPAAWQYGTGAGVKIGIVDTGVDLSQQDLQGKTVAAKDFLSDPSSSCTTASTPGQDDNGHGTHVAGIAAASGRYGVSGVAPGADLVVAKVLDCTGSGQISDVEAGIQWVVSQGAQVINLSLAESSIGGLVDPTQIDGNPLAPSLQAAWNAGAVPVVAAGNNSDGIAGLGDENYDGVPAVVVAATGPSASLASYSNQANEAQWGVAAPGGDDPQGPTTPTCGQNDTDEILSTFWTGTDPTSCYATDEGTSMATPFVTGTLALLLGRGLSPTQAVQVLLSTAVNPSGQAAGWCGSSCSGLIDTDAAMAAAAKLKPTPAIGAPAGSTIGSKKPAPTVPAPAVRASGSTAAPVSGPSGGTAPAPTTTARPSSPSTTAASPRVASLHVAASAGAHSPGDDTWWALLGALVIAALAGAVYFSRRSLATRHQPATVMVDTPTPPGAAGP